MADTTEKNLAAAAKPAPEPKADKPTPAAPAEPAPAETAAPAVDPVPDGHKRVMWVYCAADTSKNGTVEDMPAGDAHALAEGNRVKIVDDETPLGKTDRPQHPERRFAGAAADTK